MVQYHFKPNEGPEVGPIGAEELQARHEAGEIHDQTMVWRSGTVDWTTFATMRANEESALQARAKRPPPLPGKAVPKSDTASKAQFVACTACGQDWPQNLLTMEDGKPICGNCQRSRAEEIKKGRKPKSGSNTTTLTWLAVGIVCGTSLFIKLRTAHPDAGHGKIPGQAVKATP